MQDAFEQTLLAPGPHPSLGAHADSYGRIIGSWVGEIRNHMLGAKARAGSVEAHFRWALEGRAVQDVWITPARADRGADSDLGFDWYGTTLRVFDPALEAWQTQWIDPVSQLSIALVGRSQGADIVQIGTRDGRPIRWTFFDIQAETFAWQGHILNFDGKSWDLEVDIRFRRSREAT